MNNTTLRTSETLPQKSDDNDETNNLKQQQQSSASPPPILDDTSTTQIKLDENSTKPKPKRRRRKGQQSQNEKYSLSDDAKHRADILLTKLTQAIENRSKESDSHHTRPHSSFLGIEHYKDDQHPIKKSSIPSPDPYTNKLPPRSQRRSSTSTKTSIQNDNTTTNDTS